MIYPTASLKRLFFTWVCPHFYGGGGGPTQTTSTVNQSGIPDWMQPQVEALLGATTQQIFNTSPDGHGGQNITGIKPYTPYSTNAPDYISPFSPLQNQAFTGAANLQTPGQFAPAAGLASGAGMQGLGAQQNYTQQATDPKAMQNWMSPYMNDVVQYQKSQAGYDYGKQQVASQAAAAQSGAFGGARQQVQQDDTARNYNMQLQGIEAQGAQSAFQNAQQNQQYAANLGLQGAQIANASASELGQLGTQQLAAQEGILALQNQYGGQQQAQQQNILNQAVQNYATAQQYPYQQLGFMNSVIHGYATPTSASTTYQTPPSAMSQAIGGAGALAGLLGSVKGNGNAKGGLVGLALHQAMKDYKG